MVSVIIPTYNRASLLPRAIESALKQTYQDFELLVVDDGSTDNTREAVEKYAQKDKRIRYLWQENSGGAARPKNTGIQKARGEYIAILDSDDEWLPQKLEVQLHHFEQSRNPNLRVVGCDVTVVDSVTKEESPYRVPRSADPLRQLLLRDYMGPGSCMLYRRQVFKEIGLFDERLRRGQDRDMRIRIAERFDIEFVYEYLVRYYVGQPSVSSEADAKALEENWAYLFEKYRHYYAQDSKLWSEKLRYEGTRYVLMGRVRQGQKRFLESLLKYPLNAKTLLSFLVSLFGRKIYERLTKYRMKLASRMT